MDKYCTLTFNDGTSETLTLEEYTDIIEVLDVYGNDLQDDPKAAALAEKLRNTM